MIYFFEKWDKLKDKLKNKPLFIFLDFDGTLAPIADTPAKAAMPEETRRILKSLSKKTSCKVAVISGRSLEDVKSKFCGLSGIIYSGNHGLEIEGPKIKFSPLVSSGYLMAIKTIKGILRKKIAAIKGALLEDKRFSLSLHYRLVDDKQVPLLKRIFHETVIRYLTGARIRIEKGKKVLEVRLPLEWDKGKVVLWLLSRQKFVKYGSEVLPIYIGDDLTDEDAFKVLRRAGITIFVGRPDDSSYAKYYLKDTGEVARLLKDILEIQN
ncbi:MAG: trehalose-phosphatase [Candidatus Omnitrophota bacterium]|nr:trehalose-phosphatase [Candidatus Omnitrophota bacterium]